MKIKGKQPEDYVALEITVNFVTGERAGGINPRDPGLICLNLWQNLEDGVEMRLITDNRDTAQYEGIEGVTVHKGKTTINNRAKELFKARAAVANAELFAESLKQKAIDIKDIDPDADPDEQLKKCKKKGALGIRVQEPETVG